MKTLAKYKISAKKDLRDFFDTSVSAVVPYLFLVFLITSFSNSTSKVLIVHEHKFIYLVTILQLISYLWTILLVLNDKNDFLSFSLSSFGLTNLFPCPFFRFNILYSYLDIYFGRNDRTKKLNTVQHLEHLEECNVLLCIYLSLSRGRKNTTLIVWNWTSAQRQQDRIIIKQKGKIRSQKTLPYLMFDFFVFTC